MPTDGVRGVWGRRQLILCRELAKLSRRRCQVSNLPSVVDHPRDESRPAALVRGAEPASAVPVKELVEPEIVLPVRIKVKQVAAAVDAPALVVVSREQVLQPVLD